MDNSEILEKFDKIISLSKNGKQSDKSSQDIKQIASQIKQITDELCKLAENNQQIPDLSTFHALLVEDNNVNLMVAEAFLKKTGIKIETATNGLEAIDKIKDSEKRNNLYHIVFMDMQMPVMDGSEAVRLIRSTNSEYYRNLKIVAMTGNVLDEDIIKTESLGVNGYITKPVSSSMLFDVCKSLLKPQDFLKSKNPSTSNIPNSDTICNEEKTLSSSNKTENKVDISKNQYPDFSSKKVMVVDDNKLNVEIINLMLKKTGAKYVDAFDGTEAFSLYTSSKEFEYDMILMDIQMPEMDGNECAQRIRKSGRKDFEIPIIAISANAFKEDKEKSLKAGINFHMSKPVNMKNLHEKMNELFNL
ncbi:MAG: response regulator [Treponema sp.]|nr:response regulator [Treponema sp.]